MNCQNFLNDLHEYVETSLSPERQRAADAHLAQCADCRHLLRREQITAQALSLGLRQSVQHLHLPPDFQERLLAALPQKSAAKIAPIPETPQPQWIRFAWPVGIAACVLFTSFRGSHIFPGAPRLAESKAGSVAIVTPPDISLHFVYCATTYTFRRQGNQVVDVLGCEPRTVDITLHRDQPQNPL